MTDNRKISSLGTVVAASLDPSFKAVMQQWPQMVKTAAGEASDYLATLTTKQAKVFQSAYDNYGNFVNQMNTKIINSMGRSGSATEAHLSQLMALKAMATSVGDTVNSIRLSNTLDFAEAMNLRTASKLLDDIQAKANNIASGAFGKGMFVPASAPVVGPFGHGAVSGMSTSAHSANENDAYQYKLLELADRQQTAEANRESERAKRQQFQLDISRQQREDANAAEHNRMADKYNAFGANSSPSSRPPGSVPLSPAAEAVYQDEFNASRTRGHYDYSGSGGLGHLAGTVPLSPAAIAAGQEEFNASRVRGQYDYTGSGRLGMLPGTAPLSPAVQAIQQEERDQRWRNARADTGNIPGEQQRSRIFAASHAQEAEAEQRRVTEARAQSFANRMAARQDQRIPGIIANEADRDGLNYMGDDGDIDEAATGGRTLQHRSIDGRRRQGVRGRGWLGGLTRGNSHSIRFAAQNVGFGVDDAIQSYQYGGAGASIRAASNNATAIAGMLISNPIVAAGSVIVISLVSAALPMILRRFGLDKPFSDLSSTERFTSQTKANWMGGFSINENYARDKETSELTWVANQKARLIGRESDSDVQWLKASMHHGGFTNFISGMADKQVAGGHKISQNAAERKMLEAVNMDLQWRSNSGTDATATKELERNLARMEELEKEDRVLRAERGADAININRARRALPGNLKRRAEMSAYDRETDVTLNRGDMDLAAHDRRLDQRAELERKHVRANSMHGSEEQRAALLHIDMKLMEDKSDPNRQRMIQLAQFDASAGRGQFNNSLNPQNNYTQARQAFTTQYDSISRQGIEGSLSDTEVARRQNMLWKRSQTTMSRAFEDDIDNLNPERNPLKRLQRQAQRATADINAMDIDPAKKRELLLAQLRGRERDAAEAMMPSGTRKYISQGYKVGSMEDEELRSRMVGNFGPVEKKEDHANKTLDQILTALQALNDRLTIEAAKLGV